MLAQVVDRVKSGPRCASLVHFQQALTPSVIFLITVLHCQVFNSGVCLLDISASKQLLLADHSLRSRIPTSISFFEPFKATNETRVKYFHTHIQIPHQHCTLSPVQSSVPHTSFTLSFPPNLLKPSLPHHRFCALSLYPTPDWQHTVQVSLILHALSIDKNSLPTTARPSNLFPHLVERFRRMTHAHLATRFRHLDSPPTKIK